MILDEIAMHDDDPDDVVHDDFVSALYGDTPLGRPITGTVESIKALTRRQITGYYRRRYTPDRLVFAAAGSVDHAAVVRLVSRRSPGRRRWTRTRLPRRPPAAAGRRRHAGTRLVARPTEQASFVLGVQAYRRDDPRRFALGVSTPRSEVARPAGCSRRSASAAGLRTPSTRSEPVRRHRLLRGRRRVYAVQAPATCSGSVRDELAKVAAAGITVEELQRGKGQLRGSLVMGLEDSSARMTRIAKAELVPSGCSASTRRWRLSTR